MKLKNLLFTAVLTGIFAFSFQAHSALIAYDQFSGYTDGNDLNGQGQGFGWGSNNWTANTPGATSIDSGNLTYGSLSTAGGGVEAGGTSGTINHWFYRDLGTAITTAGTYYFGFLLQQTESTGNGLLKASMRLQAGNGTNVGTGQWETQGLWTLFRNDGGYTRTDTSVASDENTNYFVLKLDFDPSTSVDEVATVYINPTNAGDLTGGGNGSYTFTNDWDSISRVQGNVNEDGSSYGFANYDEIRVGSEAADMFSAIPEPSAGLLLLVGSSLLIILRRRA